MKILNLYAGLGANRHLWGDKHQVTAVERDSKIANAYRGRYPMDSVHLRDAMAFLLDSFSYFNFIWASPPCQSHSRMLRSGRNRKPRYVDMSLWQLILFCQQWVKVPWCVENVKPAYTPLVEPTAIAGRHCFWANFPLDFPPQLPPTPKNMFKTDNVAGKQPIEDWLGIGRTPILYYDGNHSPTQVLRNCVHPKIGKWVLDSIPLQVVD